MVCLKGRRVIVNESLHAYVFWFLADWFVAGGGAKDYGRNLEANMIVRVRG